MPSALCLSSSGPSLRSCALGWGRLGGSTATADHGDQFLGLPLGALGRSHLVETAVWSPHEAVFQLNSQIPPHSNSSKLTTNSHRGGKGSGLPNPHPQG